MYRKVESIVQSFCAPLVRGKYVAFCEGDDYWTDDTKLSRQTEWLEMHPEYSACVHNSMNLFCDTGRTEPYNTVFREDRDLGFEDVINGVGGIYHTSSVLVRSGLIINSPDFYYISARHHVGDHPRAIWYAMNGKIRYLNRQMSVYRSNSSAEAWSSRMNDNGFIVHRLHGAIEMYEALLPRLSGEKRRLTESSILNYRWELLQAEGDYAAMKKPPYAAVTRGKSLSQRLWLELKLCFPRLYVIYMKKGGREKSLPENLRKKYL